MGVADVGDRLECQVDYADCFDYECLPEWYEQRKQIAISTHKIMSSSDDSTWNSRFDRKTKYTGLLESVKYNDAAAISKKGDSSIDGTKILVR